MEHKKTISTDANIETGIEGLDAILGGGLPSRSQTLIVGSPGIGKTFLVTELLYNAAKKGTPCAFVAFDERPENILKNFKGAFPAMGDIDELVKKKMIVMEGNDATASRIATNKAEETGYSMGDLISDMEGIIRTNEAHIVAIDSLSFLKLMLGKTLLYNKSIAAIISNMRRMNVTTLFTLDIPYYDSTKMKFLQEMLLFDGILGLYQNDDDKDKGFGMQVIKMRGFGHNRQIRPYSVTGEGIKFK